jgi:hypothetical protein
MVHRKLKLKLLKIIVTVDNIIFFFTKVTILFKNKNLRLLWSLRLKSDIVNINYIRVTFFILRYCI